MHLKYYYPSEFLSTSKKAFQTCFLLLSKIKPTVLFAVHAYDEQSVNNTPPQYTVLVLSKIRTTVLFAIRERSSIT